MTKPAKRKVYRGVDDGKPRTNTVYGGPTEPAKRKPPKKVDEIKPWAKQGLPKGHPGR